jgi:hypothetical protein
MHEAEAKDYLTGNQLHQYCAAPENTSQNGACFGYIVRVAGALDEKPGSYCLPTGVTGRQIEDVVKLYLQNHPEARHYSASYLVSAALKEKFPCN